MRITRSTFVLIQARRLKTRSSQRILQLVGYANLVIKEAIKHSDAEWLFPRYIKDGKC